ncbi:hypothetical protein L21SP5_00403 [Salinivirga cyanobacteriivorans]|uniref:Uncharacterized protein n=1 Tax=Salinivirga cyanobacteriivorans TaxID=1307839 RepID=A0A0S2HVL6_9BACT|nr:hypothetical protein L21SP5_00403 [Salinivirga cyanobacteriivorans]
MSLALCRCKASKPADIVIYFKGLVTKQMCKDNGKHYPKMGYLFFNTPYSKHLSINNIEMVAKVCGE